MANDKRIKASTALLVITLSILSLMLIISAKQFSRLPGMLNWLWAFSLEITGTSLIASVLTVALTIFWGSSSHSAVQKGNCIHLSRHSWLTFFSFVLLGLVLSIMLFLPKLTFLSLDTLSVVASEFFVSVFVLASIAAFFKISTRRIYAFRELILVNQKAHEIVSIRNQNEVELQQAEQALDETLKAFEQDTIGRDQVREIEQTVSLIKWIQQGNPVGWYELLEDVRFGNGLRPRLRLVVERELHLVRQERNKTKVPPSINGEYENQLESLLLPSQV